MAGFELSEWVAKSPEEVFNFLTDTSNAPKLNPGIKGMQKLTEGAIGVGTRYRETRIVNGKEAQAELEVTKFDPPRAYAMVNESNGIETSYTYTLTPERDGTGVDLQAEVKAGGLKKVMAPMVVSILKREDGDHLTRLKHALEGSV